MKFFQLLSQGLLSANNIIADFKSLLSRGILGEGETAKNYDVDSFYYKIVTVLNYYFFSLLSENQYFKDNISNNNYNYYLISDNKYSNIFEVELPYYLTAIREAGYND